jgi:hypothetical protein
MRMPGFWDEHMGDGKEIFHILIWPRWSACCRSGRRTDPRHRMRQQIDIAPSFPIGSQGRGVRFFGGTHRHSERSQAPKRIDYRILDVTDYEKLLSLGPGRFDAALCNMALMDIAGIDPLMKALAVLLRPKAAFVLSILHPCFNNPSTVQMTELEDRAGRKMTYSVKVSRYLMPYTRLGAAMHEQPVPHPYLHRSLSKIIAYASGFIVDSLEERAFSAGYRTGTTAVSWSGQFSEIPPVLVA